MKEKFGNFKFKADTLKVIEQANSIIEEYQAQDYELTLRQLYYQFVARGLIANSQKSYSRVGGYIERFGDLSWELDALEPKIITSLIHKEIIEHSDMDLFKARVELQEEQKSLLVNCSENWEKVVQYIQNEGL